MAARRALAASGRPPRCEGAASDPYDEVMDLLNLDDALPDDLRDPVLVLALDGWTDAGSGGTLAAEQLRTQWSSRRIGTFDPDSLFDYRDRRPLLSIDQGVLGTPEWPSLDLHLVDVPGGPSVLLVAGAEPDFAWQALSDTLVALAEDVGAKRYIGLGAVPGPVPHTRPVRVITTSSDPVLLDRLGRPHERVVVPASCQVILESAFAASGLTTLGLWARVPHYVAGEYPLGAQVLMQQISDQLGVQLDTTVLDEDVTSNRSRLDVAAAGSDEITEHIESLEQAYDEDLEDDSSGAISGPLPTGDQIAAELERFLRNQDDD